jgi:hypothetical protein
MLRGFGHRSGMSTHAGLGFGDGYVQVRCAVQSRCLIVELHRFQSYGGFMSSKVVEANAGIHSLAMAVAVRVVIPLPAKLYTDQLRTARYKLEALWSVHFSLESAAFSLPAQPRGRFSFYLDRFNIH